MSEDQTDILQEVREEMQSLREEIHALRAEEDEERLLTKEDAARLLAVSPRTVDKLIASGEITSLKIGRARRIPRTALCSYIRAKTNGHAQTHS